MMVAGSGSGPDERAPADRSRFWSQARWSGSVRGAEGSGARNDDGNKMFGSVQNRA